MTENAQENAAAPAQSSLQTVIIGTSIIMWILAVWLINSVNSIKEELQTLKEYTQASLQLHTSPTNFRLMGPDGNVAYTIEMVPVEMPEVGDADVPATETPTPAPATE